MKYTHTRGHGGYLALRVRSSRARISALNRSGKLETLELKQGRCREQRERDLKIQFRVLEIIFVNYSKSLRLQNVFKMCSKSA
mgnify:FL=1